MTNCENGLTRSREVREELGNGSAGLRGCGVAGLRGCGATGLRGCEAAGLRGCGEFQIPDPQSDFGGVRVCLCRSVSVRVSVCIPCRRSRSHAVTPSHSHLFLAAGAWRRVAAGFSRRDQRDAGHKGDMTV
jgi:hypothetical protein